MLLVNRAAALHSERAHKLAERLLAQVPRSDRTRKIAKDLDRTRVRLDFLRRYHTLYKEYAQSELHFVDDNTSLSLGRLHPDDQAAFAFDTSVFDWKTYIQEVHCPSITRRPPDGRNPQQARQSADHDEGPGEGHCRLRGVGDLRPGRHDHVHQRDRAIPVGPLPELAHARGPLAEVGQVMRRLPSVPAGPSSGIVSCVRSTAATGALIWPPWSVSSIPPWLLTS